MPLTLCVHAGPTKVHLLVKEEAQDGVLIYRYACSLRAIKAGAVKELTGVMPTCKRCWEVFGNYWAGNNFSGGDDAHQAALDVIQVMAR